MSERKHFTLDDRRIQIIRDVMAQEEIKTESEAVRFIIDKYEEYKNTINREEIFLENMMNRIDEQYKNFFERVRWASQTSEKNTMMLLDAMNTLLIHNHVEDTFMFESVAAPVLANSEERYKDKIAHFKQMKDERKRKQEDKNRYVSSK